MVTTAFFHIFSLFSKYGIHFGENFQCRKISNGDLSFMLTSLYRWKTWEHDRSQTVISLEKSDLLVSVLLWLSLVIFVYTMVLVSFGRIFLTWKNNQYIFSFDFYIFIFCITFLISRLYPQITFYGEPWFQAMHDGGACQLVLLEKGLGPHRGSYL